METGIFSLYATLLPITLIIGSNVVVNFKEVLPRLYYFDIYYFDIWRNVSA